MSRLFRIAGMVDPHTHLRDLEWAHKATFTSETKAAVAGGYWCVLDMPNTPPTTISKAALDLKLAALKRSAVCDWGVYAGASQKDNTAEYGIMSRYTCGLKIYCNETTGDSLITDPQQRDRHFACWPDNKIIAVHAEGETVAEVLALVRKYRKRTHFVHISTAQELAYLRAAKEEGLPVTIGVCPHHLYLTESDLPSLGSLGLMKPGLKTAADRDALWRGIVEGVVDVVESDHAPHSLAEKQSGTPPYGVPGLETTLPLLLLAVREGRLSLERVVELVAERPRQIWGLACPPDTFAVVDLDASYVIDRSRLFTQCGWSPFEGLRVWGRVCETWIRGRLVYDGEVIRAIAGDGQNQFASDQ